MGGQTLSKKMLDKIKNNTTVFWTFAVVTILITGPITFLTLYEYFNVGVFKNTDGYPFGHEGPVAGVEHYKSADLYAKQMLTTGLVQLALFSLTLYFVIKRKTLGLLIFGTILIAWTIFNLVTNLSNLD